MINVAALSSLVGSLRADNEIQSAKIEKLYSRVERAQNNFDYSEAIRLLDRIEESGLRDFRLLISRSEVLADAPKGSGEDLRQAAALAEEALSLASDDEEHYAAASQLGDIFWTLSSDVLRRSDITCEMYAAVTAEQLRWWRRAVSFVDGAPPWELVVALRHAGYFAESREMLEKRLLATPDDAETRWTLDTWKKLDEENAVEDVETCVLPAKVISEVRRVRSKGNQRGQGHLVVGAVISPTGTVTNPHVIERSGSIRPDLIIAELEKSRFQPATVDGHPISWILLRHRRSKGSTHTPRVRHRPGTRR